jgi:hypothetical protein
LNRFLIEIDVVDFMRNGIGEGVVRKALVDGLGYDVVIPEFLKVRNLTDDEFRPRNHETHVHYHYHPPEGSSLAQQGSVAVIRPGDTSEWKDDSEPQPRAARVDAAFAKNLRESMELNARMKNRIFKLTSGLIGTDRADLVDRLHQILRDEDPVWPPTS